VQVHAIGEEKEQALVDRYAITRSERDSPDGDKAPVDPASHGEDWDLLTKLVVNATYRTNDSTKEMRVRLTVVDSGGEDGVTDKAYAWWRRIRKQGLSQRVRLVKGEGGKLDWQVRESMVGGKVPDVALYRLNSNFFKDMVAAGLRRTTPGPGYYHFPTPKGAANPNGWLSPTFYDEMKAEVRNENGTWTQVKPRNEAFDCSYMVMAGCNMLGCDRRGWWSMPPTWALADRERNSEIVTPDERRSGAPGVVPLPVPAVPAPQVRQLQVVPSPYLQD
jgi:phage terminase large subunit GpA-like protein